MLEKDMERKVVLEINRIGGRCYKFVSPGNQGVPDRIVILPEGRVIFVELKTERGTLTKLQEIQIARLRMMGVDVRVLCGWEAVKAFIDEVKKNAV